MQSLKNYCTLRTKISATLIGPERRSGYYGVHVSANTYLSPETSSEGPAVEVYCRQNNGRKSIKPCLRCRIVFPPGKRSNWQRCLFCCSEARSRSKAVLAFISHRARRGEAREASAGPRRSMRKLTRHGRANPGRDERISQAIARTGPTGQRLSGKRWINPITR